MSYVLKPSRSATANATTSGPSTSYVSRGHWDNTGSLPGDLVERYGDQYRSSVLIPDRGLTEYLLWAANTSNLALLEDASWVITDGTGTIPTGSLTVGSYYDGTDQIIIRDNGGREIAGITQVKVQRGDTHAIFPFTSFTSNPSANLITLDSGSLILLGGGLSLDRGDRVTEVTYYLKAQSFWWTRNDPQMTRFGWDGVHQRWAPYKGSPPSNLGPLTSDGTYVLTPKLTGYAVGDTLYSGILRLGNYPDDSSASTNVLVVSDQDALATYSFPVGVNAVVGVTNGVVQWNPITSSYYRGSNVWYVPTIYTSTSDGVVGSIRDTLFLAPIPMPTERPLLRIGSRRYLTPIMADNDVALAALTINGGEIGWSLSSGKLKLSTADINKANPMDPAFDSLYLDAVLVSDGVSLTQEPVSTKTPSQLVDNVGSPSVVSMDNDLYVPLSTPLVSGLLWVPDGTGIIPNTSAPPFVRPNGSGLVVSVEDGEGDTILFGKSGSMVTLHVVNYDSDLPKHNFKIPKGVWYVSRESGKVGLGNKDRKTFLGQPLYFLQGDVKPAIYNPQPVVYSKWKGPFTLTGREFFAFALDGVSYLWDASILGAGTFSATTVAASLQSVITGTGSVTVFRDYLVLQGDTSVEVGFGSITSGAFVDRTLSGCAALGFNPGWNTNDSFLSDAGLSFGVFRSSQNLNRQQAIPDYTSIAFVSDVVLQSNVVASSNVFVNTAPLLDVAGYSEKVHFQLVKGPYRQSLAYPHNLYYQFEDGRMSWVEEGSISTAVTEPTNALDLGHGGVLSSTLYPSVGTDYGLYLAAQGGERVFQLPDVDYTLDEVGDALLTTLVNPLVMMGYQGSYTSGSNVFTATNANLSTILPGYRLKVNSKSYIVQSVLSTTQMTVAPTFAETATGQTWEVFEGVTQNVYDPGILADFTYLEFNHLPDETFTIRVLSFAGVVGSSIVVDPVGGHTTSIRFGLVSGSAEASLTAITTIKLGTLANGTLRTPLDVYFTEGAFGVQVGDGVYSGASLIGVNTFTTGLLGDVVEYGLPGSGIDGQLNFGADVLSNRAESLVYYRQLFRDPSNLTTGEAEIDPLTGDINLSSSDITAYTGVDAYYVVTQITEKRLDVVLSPLQGTLFFNQPLATESIVEVTYAQANTDGSQNGPYQTEMLSIPIKLEAASYVDDHTWAINPSGRTIVDGAFQVWVDSRLQNYGNLQHAFLDTAGFIRFDYPVPVGSVVQVNYAVYETFGGEQSFQVSKIPVYRPPFYIPAGSSSFTLSTDRTADVPAGTVLRMGAYPLYIKSSSYDVVSDTTQVTFFPTTPVGLGSLAPGNDINSWVSSGVVVDSVDGVPTGGPSGFMLTLSAPYENVSPGQNLVKVMGDVTEFVVPGHLFEIGGYPYLISGVSYDTEGLFTSVTFTTSCQRSFIFGVDTMRVSARPIYPPDARDFLGIGIPVGSSFELVRFSSGNPGVTLTQNVDYTVDPSNGNVSLLYPFVKGLSKGEWLLTTFTKERIVSPTVEDGVVIVPTYGAVYDYITTPNDTNGYLSGTLVGTFAYSSPDSFYTCAEPMTTYMGEVAQIALQRIASQQPNAGSILTQSTPSNNWNYGQIPLTSEIRALKDQDRVGRQYITDYNSTIVYFEQILETISGDVIGDRDGKFRFFVGQGLYYAPPGYEDDITGYLNTRFIWGDLFESVNGSITPIAQDPVVNPDGATQNPITLQVTGSVMNPWLLDYYIQQQDSFVLNDMDDVVLVGTGRNHLSYQPPLKFTVYGAYQAMWYPSVLSRLYPESTLAFTTTYPGLNSDFDAGDPGTYSFAKIVQAEDGPVLASTFNKDIATISNPALGTIRGITGQTKVRERLARAHVWGYSPDGYPDLEPATSGKPSILISIVPLDQFPINPETGYPDVTLLAAQGGDVYDLTTGDPDLSTPVWDVYDAATDTYPQLALGKPDGSTYQIGSGTGSITNAMGVAYSSPIPKGIYVDAIYAGCIITLTDGSGTITNPDSIVRVGIGVLYPFAPEYGDTIYVITPYAVDASTFSDPPTFNELKKFAKNQPLLDVGIRERKGTFVDRSLPSINDPAFPIKEIVNQKTASPVGCIEADVEFANTMKKPFAFPALQGLDTNDSGDYSIPYLTTANTELDRLAQVSATFNTLVLQDNPSNTASVYPNEILANDGAILSVGVGINPPATLLTSADLSPTYTPHSGVGSVSEYDLLLVEVGQTGIPEGCTGILSVGAVGVGTLEIPRFTTSTKMGARLRYTFSNAMAHLTSSGTTGMVVTEFGGSTILSISTIAGLVLNNGTAFPVGGLNDLINPFGAVDNILTFRLIDQTTGLVLESITYNASTSTVTGSLGSVVMGAVPVFQQKALVIPAIGFAATLGSQVDFTLSIDAYNTGLPNSGSLNAYIGTDRLTFYDSYDLSSVLPRGTLTTGGVSVQGELDVLTVTASGVDSDINASSYTNGGVPFTFLERNGVVGSFGGIKVMSWEGYGNIPVPCTDVTFSAVPSAIQDANGDILAGTANIDDGHVYLDSVSVATGSLANVVSGDIVVVDQSSIGDAAIKSGTYLVRHAVDATIAGPPPYADVDTRSYAGANAGWAQVRFPVVVSSDLGSLSIVVDEVQPVYASPSGYDFDSTGRIYVISDPNDFTSILYANYSAFTVGTNVTFTIISGSVRDVSGGVQPDAALFALASQGTLVSGMSFVPVGSILGVPNNVVGANTGANEVGGFIHVTLDGAAGSLTFSSPGTLVDSTGGVPAANKLGVWVSDATYTANSQSFISDPRTPVYQNVPMFLDLRGFGAIFAVGVNGNPNLRSIMPNTKLDTNDGAGTAGFHALAGVFLEPSIPLSTQDLSNGIAKIVDLTHSYTNVGMRDAASYGLGPSESVQFTVKRIRRFHQFDAITRNLQPLRFAYEIRRGDVVSYNPNTFITVLTDTQLGNLLSKDVNVHSGDVLRILDPVGGLLDMAEIASIITGNTVRLRAPGFTNYQPTGGEDYQIYLRQAPVPQLQSNAQLYEANAELLYETTANPSTGVGGKVTVTNVLEDPTVTDFTAITKEGDYVVVDPAGLLRGPSGYATPLEYGTRPIGDQSVSVRVGPWVAGSPSQLDDNRGFYKVVSASTHSVNVSNLTDFSGDAGNPVIYGASGQEYAVLPEINASGLTGNTEGQMDLRRTAPANGSNSYLGNWYSIEPFSYQIIRNKGLLSDESFELMLFIRERMLSWVEELSFSYGKYGTYYVFQRDEHISHLGMAGDVTSGLGVASNAYITSLIGLTQYAPFANTDDCLSVLDRRYWCLDLRLDREFPPYSVGGDPYASFENDYSFSGYVVGSGRPVEPDRISSVLNDTDQLRDLRYAWIDFRANRINGTLTNIDRFYAELPERLAAQKEWLLMQAKLQ